MKLLIKFPTKGRKEQFFTVLDRYYEYLSGKHDFQFIITIDSDDAQMSLCQDEFDKYKNLLVYCSNNKSKIEAINKGVELCPDWDVLLLASDDMIPIAERYDDIIIRNMKQYFPDTDGVLWFNDGYRGQEINTLAIIGRKYYDRFGYIYHPDYNSVYCDDEFTQVSKMLNKVKYFHQPIIRHEHPNNNRGVAFDERYRHTESFYFLDRQTFERRKSNNFYVPEYSHINA